VPAAILAAHRADQPRLEPCGVQEAARAGGEGGHGEGAGGRGGEAGAALPRGGQWVGQAAAALVRSSQHQPARLLPMQA